MASKTRRKCPACGKVWATSEGSQDMPGTVCIGCRGKVIAEALAKVRRIEEKERINSNGYRPDSPTPTYFQIRPQYALRDYEPYVEASGTGGEGGNRHIPLLGPIEISLKPEPKKPRKPRKPRKKKEEPAPPKKRDKWETVKV